MDGELYAWGHNTQGQVGDGTFEARLTPTKIMNDVVRAYAGGDRTHSYSAAVKKDDSLWIWGNNLFGQLGVNMADQNTPVHILNMVGMNN